MRYTRLLAFSLLAFLAGCGSKPSSGSSVSMTPGPSAPAIEASQLDGGHFSLASMKGKVVFVDFWATWCPPCVRSVPEVKKLEEDYAAKGLEVVSVSLDEDIEALRQFVAANGMKNRIPLGASTNVMETYRIQGIPMFVIIDREGRIAQIWKGFHPSMVPEWRSRLDRMLQA